VVVSCELSVRSREECGARLLRCGTHALPLRQPAADTLPTDNRQLTTLTDEPATARRSAG
jgi:hypothetical protein